MHTISRISHPFSIQANVKLRFSEKVIKFDLMCHLDLMFTKKIFLNFTLVNVKSKWIIKSNYVAFLEKLNFKTVKSWLQRPIPSRQARHCWLKARRRKYVIWINIAHREHSTLCTAQSCVLLRLGLDTIFFDEVLRQVADKDCWFFKIVEIYSSLFNNM